MVLAIVVVVFALAILLGLWPGWKDNGRGVNIFYLVCLCVSFPVLLLASLDVPLPDPTKLLAEWFKAMGLGG